MPRQRNPQRDLSMRRYLEKRGKISIEELAQAAGVPKARISKWKSEDRWEEQLKKHPKKQGAQPGNKNAAGKTPTKKGNKNAVTHGAYAHPDYKDISEEAAEQIRQIQGGESMGKMLEELRSLMVRKEYLEEQLKRYNAPEADGMFYTDKLVHMIVPKSFDEQVQERDAEIEAGTVKDPEGTGTEQLKTAMKTIIKSSAFDRSMKIEAELNRLHGRIIKQLDSIRGCEMEERRLNLEERRYNLAKQKLTGVFDVDDETGEIIDDLIDDEDGTALHEDF